MTNDIVFFPFCHNKTDRQCCGFRLNNDELITKKYPIPSQWGLQPKSTLNNTPLPKPAATLKRTHAPPSNYVCNICMVAGHWRENCTSGFYHNSDWGKRWYSDLEINQKLYAKKMSTALYARKFILGNFSMEDGSVNKLINFFVFIFFNYCTTFAVL